MPHAPDATKEIALTDIYTALDDLESTIKTALETFSAVTGLPVHSVKLSPILHESAANYNYDVKCVVTL